MSKPAQKYIEQLHVPQDSRIVKFASKEGTFYFSTNQWELSYKLAIELFGLIFKVRPSTLEMYAQNHLKVNIESTTSATINIHERDTEILLELL